MNRKLLEVDEVFEAPSCPGWSQRGMQPVGFPFGHSHAALPQAPAATARNVAQLVAEVAQMRAQFSRALAEIEQRLSRHNEPRSPSRRGRPNRRGAEQRTLPILPRELSAISSAIEDSMAIVNCRPDPSDDLALSCSQEAWRRATKILIDHALSVWEKIKVVVRPPVISPGPEGSVDLYWTAAPYGLLLNVPANPKEPATYFGDDARNPDSNRTSGKLDLTKPTDIGVLMWLAHTAEQ